jgi:hypothetical protein
LYGNLLPVTDPGHGYSDYQRPDGNIEVAATETKIASGAARAAFAVSSEMWAAES